ncbi:chorismate mutase [Devosia limi]|uniref:chorismate mutase n=1 Tax=Devosia limi DSM 17137 TaxID=1121477 RepID=A0A1M4UYQ1_9HYPH|nr:chorismate mutase [Devosia limi DSM 17137]
MTHAIDSRPELAALRSSIDNLDASLIFILSERFRLTRKVGELKAHHKLPAADGAREDFQIARLRRLAEEAQLDPVFAERFLRFIIEEVIQHHRAAAGADA